MRHAGSLVAVAMLAIAPHIMPSPLTQRTRRAMTLVGIPSEEQDAVFATVAAVLHLGNVAFVEAGEADSSKVALYCILMYI